MNIQNLDFVLSLAFLIYLVLVLIFKKFWIKSISRKAIGILLLWLFLFSYGISLAADELNSSGKTAGLIIIAGMLILSILLTIHLISHSQRRDDESKSTTKPESFK